MSNRPNLCIAERRRHARLAIAVSMVFAWLAASACASAQADPQGAWGGAHVALVIGAARSDFELDCAHGRIDGPFRLDDEGRFDLRGVYIAEHGGPMTDDETLSQRPAHYRGEVRGPRMTLTISIAGVDAAIGPLSLQRGQTPKVFKCL